MQFTLIMLGIMIQGRLASLTWGGSGVLDRFLAGCLVPGNPRLAVAGGRVRGCLSFRAANAGILSGLPDIRVNRRPRPGQDHFQPGGESLPGPERGAGAGCVPGFPWVTRPRARAAGSQRGVLARSRRSKTLITRG